MADNYRRADRTTPPYLQALMAEAARQFTIPVELILQANREARVAAARQVVFFVLREQGLTLPHIAHLMGRDHSTVLYGIRKVEESTPLMWTALGVERAVLPETEGATA